MCLLIAPTRLCSTLRLTNGSFHTTQAETQSIASVFISGLFGAADDVHETPVVVFTDAFEDSQAVGSNNTVDSISQSSVSRNEATDWALCFEKPRENDGWCERRTLFSSLVWL